MQRLAVGVFAVTSAALSAAPARACTYGAAVYLAQPENGATGVPTNVVPWLFGTPFGLPVAITLRDGSGAQVPVDVLRMTGHLHKEYIEVVPRSPLAPWTHYALTAEVEGHAPIEGTSTFSFTTGDGPLEEMPPALGALDMQIADNSSAGSSCGDHVFACVSAPPNTVVMATVTVDSEVEAELIWHWPGAPLYSRSESAIASPFCIDLRARTVAGALGPPSRVCSDSSPIYRILTTEPVGCDAGRVVTNDGYADEIGRLLVHTAGGGCSATGLRLAPLWPLILALLGLARRRPRPTASKR